MHIHILGICGTFMGSLAQLAKAQGHRVTGCDANVYPPMSTQLEQAGIELIPGFDPAQLKPAPDLVVVGNAMSRGNELIEALLESTIPFMSGPQWLHDYVLPGKWVLAVAGTHGKTTTSSMLCWVLESAGMDPGYLIGGVPKNFEHSARLSPDSPFFVVEADEYDTAFFDKRSKFVHYAPRTVVINNLEFDHADIFADLASIQRQFHHLLRIVPRHGLIIYPQGISAIDEVIRLGCWSEQQTLVSINDSTDADWRANMLLNDGSRFEILFKGQLIGVVEWNLIGQHNVMNALAAAAAAHHVGVQTTTIIEGLNRFEGVARRMELIGSANGVNIYDDFAHHPTAIATTLAGLRASVGEEKILALIEPRSNTMRAGAHKKELSDAFKDADAVFWYQPPELEWDLDELISGSPVPAKCFSSIDDLVKQSVEFATKGSHLVIMSNGGFGGIHQKIVARIEALE